MLEAQGLISLIVGLCEKVEENAICMKLLIGKVRIV